MGKVSWSTQVFSYSKHWAWRILTYQEVWEWLPLGLYYFWVHFLCSDPSLHHLESWGRCVFHKWCQESRDSLCAVSQERVPEPASHLPWSFPSVRGTKVYTCQLPYIFEHQMHTTAHARPDNLPWIFEAILWFRSHPFHFEEEQCCFWGGHRILSPEEKPGNCWHLFSPVLHPRNSISFFRGQVLCGSASASSLSSLTVYAVSPASFTHVEPLQ